MLTILNLFFVFVKLILIIAVVFVLGVVTYKCVTTALHKWFGW